MEIALLRLYPEDANGLVIRDLAARYVVVIFSRDGTVVVITGEKWKPPRSRSGYMIVSGADFIDVTHLSVGTVGNLREKTIRKEDDLGYNNTLILVDIPSHGVCFCRAVGGNWSDSEMACVLFDTTGGIIADKYAFKGLLGKWEDICQ